MKNKAFFTQCRVTNISVEVEKYPWGIHPDRLTLFFHHHDHPIAELQLICHLGLMRPVDGISHGPYFIREELLGFGFTVCVTFLFRFGKILLVNLDYPEFGVLGWLLTGCLFRPLTCELGRFVNLLALFKVVASDGFRTQAVNEFQCQPNG